MTIELICWVILLMIVTCFVLSAFWFVWTLDQTGRDNEVKREIKLTHFRYDENGNPIDFYDPRTGIHFVRSVGNTRHEPIQNFIVGNSPIAPIPREKQELPLTVYVGGKPKVRDTPTQIETVQTVQELEANNPRSSENVLNERDFVSELARLKGEKVGKERAILQVCNVRKGGSEAWKYWSTLFDQLD